MKSNLPRDTQSYLLTLKNAINEPNDQDQIDWVLAEYEDYFAKENIIPAIKRGVDPITAFKQELWRYQQL